MFIFQKHFKNFQKFECDTCPLWFATSNRLQIHKEKSCDQEKSKACPTCNIVFSYESYLEKHKLICTARETNICEYCSKEFRYASGLKAHIKTSHLKIKDHICNECGEAFSKKKGYASLELHKLKMHGGQKTNLCFLCGSSFYTGAGEYF
jgi:uncharacterized Zn-finger protein